MRTLNTRFPRHALLLGSMLLLSGLVTGSLIAAGPSQSSTSSPEHTDNADAALSPVVRVNPLYPRSAAIEGITGSVLLEGQIETDGSVSNVRVIESEPEGVFEEQAIAAFAQWRFEPTVGRTIDPTGPSTKPLKVKQRIDFVLDSQDG